MKRFILLLSTLLLLCGLIACNESDAETTQAETEAEVPEATFSLVENGEAAYAIILPEGSSGEMREAVNSFASKISAIYGVKFEVKKNKNLAEGKRLITVGAQEDGTHADLFSEIPYNKYAVRLTDDGNIAVVAWSVSTIGDACSKLIMKLEKSFSAGDTVGTLTEEWELDGKDASLLDAAVPNFAPTQMPWLYHVQGARGAYELCFKSSTLADWNGYIGILQENGFEIQGKTENYDASFAVLLKDGLEITVDFWNKTGELIVIVDKPATEKPFKSEAVNATTVPKVIEPGLEYAGALKGTCYVIQASDGSFVIVDSGDSDPKFLDRLYSTMKPLIPEGEKPHIRAWFITHAHGDHMSGLVDIAESKYASLIECDAVYTNMPYESYQKAYDKSTYANRISKLEKAAKTLGADYVTARTGQTYYFADIEISVLGSVDDMFLTEYDDLDQTSLVFSVKAGGKRLIFSGDSGPVYIGQYINKRYTAETLKCDIVQATSHGQNGDALTAYYKMTDADYYLWSATKEFYNKHTPNKHIEGDKSAKIIYSFDGAYTVELK